MNTCGLGKEKASRIANRPKMWDLDPDSEGGMSYAATLESVSNFLYLRTDALKSCSVSRMRMVLLVCYTILLMILTRPCLDFVLEYFSD